jgi:hypothetical protein
MSWYSISEVVRSAFSLGLTKGFLLGSRPGTES